MAYRRNNGGAIRPSRPQPQTCQHPSQHTWANQYEVRVLCSECGQKLYSLNWRADRELVARQLALFSRHHPEWIGEDWAIPNLARFRPQLDDEFVQTESMTNCCHQGTSLDLLEQTPEGTQTDPPMVDEKQLQTVEKESQPKFTQTGPGHRPPSETELPSMKWHPSPPAADSPATVQNQSESGCTRSNSTSISMVAFTCCHRRVKLSANCPPRADE